MKRPPKGQLWIHIDHLDREDGLVWAIQHRSPKGLPSYTLASNVIIRSACAYTQFFGAKAQQPRAVIVVPGGTVAMSGTIAVIS